MIGKKKIDFDQIDPLDVHYIPQENKKNLSLVTESKESPVPESWLLNPDSLVKFYLGDSLKFAYKAGLAYFTGGISLLRDIKFLSWAATDLLRGDWETIKMRIFKTAQFKKGMIRIENYINANKFDLAIEEINSLAMDLENIDNHNLRAILFMRRALIHLKQKRFRSAYESFMLAAENTVVSESKKMDANGVKAFINVKASYYLMALRVLAIHLEKHGVIEDDLYSIKDISERAKFFFQKESDYRKKNKLVFSKKGDFKIGSFSIPYGFFEADNVSPEINLKYIAQVEYINSMIVGQWKQVGLAVYLKDKLYKNDNIETLFKLADEATQVLEKNTFNDVLTFNEYLIEFLEQKKAQEDLKLKAEIYKINTIIKFGKTSENDLLRIFKYLDQYKDDEERFSDIFFLADRMSMSWSYHQRKVFSEMMLKKKYPLINNDYKLTYQRIIGQDAPTKEALLLSFYPKSKGDLEKGLNELPVKDYEVIYRGNVHFLKHEDMLNLMIKRGVKLFPNQDLSQFAHRINTNAISQDTLNGELSEIGLILEKVNSTLGLGEKLAYLKERATTDKPRIGVFGLTKTGKSTFLNALFQREFLKVDRGVATNIITMIKVDNKNSAKVEFIDGKTKEIDLNEVNLYTSEQENPDNKKNVSRVKITIQSPLPRGFEVLDIPGFGANTMKFKLHEDVVDEALKMVDGVFFMTAPNDGLKEYELKFIEKSINRFRLPTYLIANKIDMCDEDEVADYINGVHERSDTLKLNEKLSVIGVSSQLGLSYINNIDLDKLMGWDIEEAKITSNMDKIYKEIESFFKKVSNDKNSNILKKILDEVENLKNDKRSLIQKIKNITKEGTGNLSRDIEFIDSTLNGFKKDIEIDLMNSLRDQITQLELISAEKIASKIKTNGHIGVSTSIKEDLSFIESACIDFFNEEASYPRNQLEQIDEQFKAKMNELVKSLKEHLPGMAPSQIVEKLPFNRDKNFTIIDKTVHFLKKLLDVNSTIVDKAEIILQQLKDIEIQHWQEKEQVCELIFRETKEDIIRKLKELNELKEFKTEELNKSLSFNLDVISKCDKLQKMIKDKL